MLDHLNRDQVMVETRVYRDHNKSNSLSVKIKFKSKAMQSPAALHTNAKMS